MFWRLPVDAATDEPVVELYDLRQFLPDTGFHAIEAECCQIQSPMETSYCSFSMGVRFSAARDLTHVRAA